MDLIYLSENFAFDSMRSPIQSKYKGSWRDDEYSENKPTSSHNSKHGSKEGKTSHCLLCQEKSKKQLASYIRQKSSCNTKNCIPEEEDEE